MKFTRVVVFGMTIGLGWLGIAQASDRIGARERLKATFDAIVANPDSTRLPIRSSFSGMERWANALDVVLPPPPNVDELTGRVAGLYAKSLQEYYTYYASALRHRRAMFDWQLFSGQAIFYAVIFLVLSGVVFAAVQFFRFGPTESSTLVASVKGLRVSSPILGVIILTISLLFFYLYLVYVYPIHEAIVPR